MNSRLMHELEIVDAYRHLFLDENGRPKPDAVIVFNDLRKSLMFNDVAPVRDDTGRIDPSGHIYRDGARAMFEHINNRVSTDPALLQMKMERATQE